MSAASTRVSDLCGAAPGCRRSCCSSRSQGWPAAATAAASELPQPRQCGGRTSRASWQLAAALPGGRGRGESRWRDRAAGHPAEPAHGPLPLDPARSRRPGGSLVYVAPAKTPGLMTAHSRSERASRNFFSVGNLVQTFGAHSNSRRLRASLHRAPPAPGPVSARVGLSAAVDRCLEYGEVAAVGCRAEAVPAVSTSRGIPS